jgi:DivIVA domain-containing protein
MVLVVLICVALGALLVWALYAEPAPPRPVAATWSDPRDVRRHGFRLVPVGYDPRAVDAHLERVAALLEHRGSHEPPAEAPRAAAPELVAAPVPADDEGAAVVGAAGEGEVAPATWPPSVPLPPPGPRPPRAEDPPPGG